MKGSPTIAARTREIASSAAFAARLTLCAVFFFGALVCLVCAMWLDPKKTSEDLH